VVLPAENGRHRRPPAGVVLLHHRPWISPASSPSLVAWHGGRSACTRAGTPGLDDSSLGGPLLWPADDPWPTCQHPHDRLEWIPLPPEISSWDQAVQWAQGTGLSVVREGDGPIFAQRHRGQLPELASPLVGVLQLYARDVPQLPFPESTNLPAAVVPQ
jgi:hypothetical protein